MPGVSAADLGELAVRVMESVSPNPWFVLMVEGHAEDVASALQEEISALAAPIGPAASRVTVASSRELARVARDHTLGVLIVTISPAFTPTEWANVDVNRSRFQRDGATVLVLEEDAAEHLENTAPNLASWIGSSIWRLVDAQALSAAEKGSSDWWCCANARAFPTTKYDIARLERRAECVWLRR
jgi:hypothetical protein